VHSRLEVLFYVESRLVCFSNIIPAQDGRSRLDGQKYAAYVLRTTYYERGYMSADVII